MREADYCCEGVGDNVQEKERRGEGKEGFIRGREPERELEQNKDQGQG
jgi:hypothetical protein